MVKLGSDSAGRLLLSLSGDCKDEMASVLQEGAWDVLGLLGVDWPDYSPLIPYASRIKHLRVPFGPDSSRGLEQLEALEILESTDILRPPVDFRKLELLTELSAIWDGKRPQHYAVPGLRRLTLGSVGGSDLQWLPNDSMLEYLELRGGRLRSLDGIGQLRHLSELRVRELNWCNNVLSVASLSNLTWLLLDTPKASLDTIDFIGSMPCLNYFETSAVVHHVDWGVVAAATNLKSIAVVMPFADADECAIRKAFEPYERTIKHLKVYCGNRNGSGAGVHLELS